MRLTRVDKRLICTTCPDFSGKPISAKYKFDDMKSKVQNPKRHIHWQAGCLLLLAGLSLIGCKKSTESLFDGPSDWPPAKYSFVNASDSCKVKELRLVYFHFLFNLDTVPIGLAELLPGDSFKLTIKNRGYTHLLSGCDCPDTSFYSSLQLEGDTLPVEHAVDEHLVFDCD